MMMMLNWFCGMTECRKTLKLISTRDHSQGSSSQSVLNAPGMIRTYTKSKSSHLRAEFKQIFYPQKTKKCLIVLLYKPSLR